VDRRAARSGALLQVFAVTHAAARLTPTTFFHA